MNREIWHSSFKDEIELSVLKKEEINSILGLWNKDLKFDDSKLESLQSNRLFPYLTHNRSKFPLRSVLASVTYHYSVFGLIEEPYLDLEFWDSHAGFYSSSFSQYRIDCIRIHFFAGEESLSSELIDLLYSGCCRHEVEEALDVKWKGYCVLRPIHSYVVGRTGIEFDTRCAERLPNNAKIKEEGGSRPFLKAFQECSVNLLNARFTIKTPEFIQQDPNLGHCATASLWVATKLMSNKFGTNKFNYRTITSQAFGAKENQANFSNSPLPPDRGLTPSEIKNAINATGANTLTFIRKDESYENVFSRLTHEIYSFMESGFPVILCITNSDNNQSHVVSVVGHSLPGVENPNNYVDASFIFPKEQRNEKMKKHFLIGNIINLYYVHDDAYGPFNRVIFQNKRKEVVKTEKQEKGSVFRPGNSKQKKSISLKLGRISSLYELDQVLIPVPSNIKATSTSVFRDIVKVFNDDHFDSYDDLVFLWRPVLIEGSDFKQSICRRKYPPSIRKKYANLHLPKFIWLFELSILKPREAKSYFNYPNYKPRLIDGEYIYDATISGKEARMISARISNIFCDYRSPKEYVMLEGKIKRYDCFQFSCHDQSANVINSNGDCHECFKQRREAL